MAVINRSVWINLNVDSYHHNIELDEYEITLSQNCSFRVSGNKVQIYANHVEEQDIDELLDEIDAIQNAADAQSLQTDEIHHAPSSLHWNSVISFESMSALTDDSDISEPDQDDDEDDQQPDQIDPLWNGLHPKLDCMQNIRPFRVHSPSLMSSMSLLIDRDIASNLIQRQCVLFDAYFKQYISQQIDFCDDVMAFCRQCFVVNLEVDKFCRDDVEWKEQWLGMADKCREAEEYYLSYDIMRLLIECDPNDPHLYNNLAFFMHSSLSDIETAKQIYCKSLGIDRGSDVTLYYFGVLLVECGEYEQASQCLAEAASRSPTKLQYLWKTAECFYKLNKVEEAEMYFQKTVVNEYQTNTVTSTCWSKYADFLQVIGEYDKSMEALHNAVCVKPDSFYAVFQMAFGLMNQLRFEDALKWLLAALQINNSDPSTLWKIGECLQKLGEFDEAEIYFQRSLKFGKESVTCLAEYIILLCQRSQFEEAAKMVQSIQITDDCNEYVLWALAECHRDGFRDYKKAQMIYNQCIEMTKSAINRTLLETASGYLMFLMGETDTAKDCLDNVIKQEMNEFGQEWSFPFFYRGLIYFDDGDINNADLFIEKAVEKATYFHIIFKHIAFIKQQIPLSLQYIEKYEHSLHEKLNNSKSRTE